MSERQDFVREAERLSSHLTVRAGWLSQAREKLAASGLGFKRPEEEMDAAAQTMREVAAFLRGALAALGKEIPSRAAPSSAAVAIHGNAPRRSCCDSTLVDGQARGCTSSPTAKLEAREDLTAPAKPKAPLPKIDDGSEDPEE